MTDIIEPVQDELASLKARADRLGISYSNNIGVETLREKINAKIQTNESETPKANSFSEVRKQVYKDAMKLIRCKIVCLNPSKRDLNGEIFTVANSVIGKVSRYVPYTSPASDSWHLPNCIVQFLKSKKYTDIRTPNSKNKKQIAVKYDLVPEFNIIELPPLTKEELAKLAAAQKAAGSISEEE